MSIKQQLMENLDLVFKAKSMIDTLDPELISHKIINGRNLDEETISIVMTTNNRPQQTFFTLKTIEQSIYKNVQVIIVDDYKQEQFSIEELSKYNFQIDYVRFPNKFWINPCVNYNLGFKIAKGTKIIIQNAEVCHIGDVINYVSSNVNENEYHIFDAFACPMMDNIKLHTLQEVNYETTQLVLTNIGTWDQYFSSNKIGTWYQHSEKRNNQYHFLTALTKNTLEKIGGFDIDYCLGTCWDDVELILRIKNTDIKIINVESEKNKILGIHQWHIHSPHGYGYIHNNEYLHRIKLRYNKIYKKHFSLTQESDDSLNITEGFTKCFKNYQENYKENYNYEKQFFDLIPKVMHTFYNEFNIYNFLTVYSFKFHHPDWLIKIYTCEDSIINNKFITYLLKNKLIEIIKLNFDNEDYFKKTPLDAKKDYLSYLVLSKEGGVWSDSDIIYVKPITDFKIEKDMIIGEKNKLNMMLSYNNQFYIAFMISQPNNPFFKQLMDKALDYIQNNNYLLGNGLIKKYYTDMKSIKLSHPELHIINLPENYYLPSKNMDIENFLYNNITINNNIFGVYTLFVSPTYILFQERLSKNMIKKSTYINILKKLTEDLIIKYGEFN